MKDDCYRTYIAPSIVSREGNFRIEPINAKVRAKPLIAPTPLAHTRTSSNICLPFSLWSRARVRDDGEGISASQEEPWGDLHTAPSRFTLPID